MFEYILVFVLGLFVGLGIDDAVTQQREDISTKKQKMVLEKIKNDYDRGYVPDFEAYRKLYNKYNK